jgi:3-dehydroquinate dehydratase-2
MTAHLLVLHGPGLHRLGKGKLLSEPSVDALNAALDFSATASDIKLQAIHAETDQELARAVEDEGDWATHILVSPGALAPTAYLLRQALLLADRPFAEVFVDALPDSSEHRKRSVLKEVSRFQKQGAAIDVYAEAAGKLLGVEFAKVPPKLVHAASKLSASTALTTTSSSASTPSTARAKTSSPQTAPARPAVMPKTIGHRVEAKTVTAKSVSVSGGVGGVDVGNGSSSTNQPPTKRELGKAKPARVATGKNTVVKTIGKGSGAVEKQSRSTSGVTRAVVRQQIANRLSGKISAGQLATWGREQWLAVDRGGPTEAGHRDLLEEVLQALALSSMPGNTLSDPELIEWMARMG